MDNTHIDCILSIDTLALSINGLKQIFQNFEATSKNSMFSNDATDNNFH